MAMVVATILALAACAAPTPALSPADKPIPAEQVRTTDLKNLRPPSPDTSGLTYIPQTDELVIVDSEVEEGKYFRGVNMWGLTRRGVVQWTGSTLRYSREPSGVAYNPKTRRLFVSEDDADRVLEVRAGRDSRLGTEDDIVSGTDVQIFNDQDTEDVALNTSTSELLLVDAKIGRVHKLAPGSDGQFNGISPKGDDRPGCPFDFAKLGAKDVEGLTYDAARDTIFLVSHHTNYVYEVTPTGELVTLIDISDTYPTKVAGVVRAPASSADGTTSLYLVDRGVDNDKDPNANDGQLHELRVHLPKHTPDKRAGGQQQPCSR